MTNTTSPIPQAEEGGGKAVGHVDCEGRVTWYDPIPEGGALLYARPAGFPGCSGCPDSCPENEGYGCCREELAAPGAAAAAPAEAALRQVLAVIQRYLPPGGPSAQDAISEIIAVVDPWPLGRLEEKS